MIKSNISVTDRVGGLKWDYIHGILGNAIYGGRIDNAQDMKVLTCYLEFYFSNQMAKDTSTPLAPGVYLPNSNNMGVSYKIRNVYLAIKLNAFLLCTYLNEWVLMN